jgi:tetratricopeptide (TPR) repeat protein
MQRPSDTVSRKKAIVFSLVPVTVLLLLLGLAEVVLRLTKPVEEPGLVREVKYDGIEWFETDRSYLRNYFSNDSPTIPEFKTTLFRKTKLAGALRVMCLGSSTMFGTPYDMNANVGGIVRKQLRRLLPGREVEVINWGASAINSNVVRDFAPALLAYQPDLVLVYMGHNEFYGPDGVGAPWLEKRVPFLAGWRRAILSLRLSHLVQSWFRPAGRPSREEAGNLMKQVSGGSLVPLNSPDAERIFSRYEENLRHLILTFRGHHVPIVVSDLTSNLMFPPFVSDSLHGTYGGFRALDFVRHAFDAGQYDTVLSFCRGLSPVDSSNAFVSYWAGRAALEAGDSALASRLLVSARDNDLLKFRAPSRINEIIHRVCTATETPLVRTDSVFFALSPGGVPGDSLFWEHLHPTLKGYYIIAEAFLKEILERGLIDARVSQIRPCPLNPDSLGIAWMELAYADVSIQHLTGRWPFENYERQPVVLGSADPILIRIVMDIYNRATPWAEGLYKSASYFWSRGRLRDAQTTYEAMLEEYPYGFYANYLLGSLLNTSGRRDEALAYYRRSVASNPDFPRARVDLGLLEVNSGAFSEAITLLSATLPLTQKPETRDLRSLAFYGLGAAYANTGDYTKALEMLNLALETSPGNLDAVKLRAEVLKVAGGRGR